MCGIFGYLGFDTCFKYGINGLKQLQNRGYDSAGCCAISSDKSQNKKFILRKFATTKNMDSVVALEQTEEDFADCTNGIFHTRWATHGAKTDANSHPHLDNSGKIALVHNGIIENYYELKLELESKGYHFDSETDTEVIVNLISMYYDQTEDENGVKHMEEAIMQATSRLQGTWGLVVICEDKPDNLYCARHGSGLLVGFGGSFIMVTSEQAGFNNYVTNYVCLNNNDITVIRRRDNKVTFDNIENYVLRNVTVTANELTPEPYLHWTLKEIHEQYESSIRSISFGGRIVDNDSVRLGGPGAHEEELKDIEHIILLGCGTSLNACQGSIEFFKDLCEFTTVQAFDAAEFTSSDIPKRGKSCAIFLSQSGETKDLFRCIAICDTNNVFTIGVINVVDSLIARSVHCGCYLNAGRETAVASTKAFTSQIIILSMIAIFFAQINNLNKSKREQYIKALRQLPTDIKKTIQTTEETCKSIANYLVDQKDLFILGKGSMIACASEAALKVKEISYIHAESYGGNALRHGPYAIISDGTPIIFLNPNDQNFALMNNTISEVSSRHAYPIVISDTDNVSIHSCQNVLVQTNSIYKGVLHNIPIQLIAYYTSILKGINPDKPKNLSKVVSV
jgi:glutamine---fructose-6-phosphate transaminase (isomerizing)